MFRSYIKDVQDDDKLNRIQRLNMLAVLANLTARRLAVGVGVHVDFDITQAIRIDKVEVLRSLDKDVGNALVVQSFALPGVGTFVYDDQDTTLVGRAVSYWIRASGGDTNDVVTIGPTTCDLSTSDVTPPAILDAFSVSHAAGVNGAVRVTVNGRIKDDTQLGSVRIYVTGYKGVAIKQSVAQESSRTFSFNLAQTGETITVYAAPVSTTGVEADPSQWLSQAITLGVAATVPAKVLNAFAVNTSYTNVQITFEATDDAGLLDFKVYRGPRGLGFGSASLYATIALTGSRQYVYTDTAVADQYDWFILGRNATGNGAASDAINPTVVYNSSFLPINSPVNQQNNATVDSVDPGGGVGATARIYGPGGVGTAWTQTTGFGGISRAAGSITGLSYGIFYYIVFNLLTGLFEASLTNLNALPDYKVWAGKLQTVAAGGAGGQTGGGSGTGITRGGGLYNTL